MSTTQILSITLLLINGIAAAGLAGIGWRRRKLSGGLVFSLMMALIALWSFTLMVEFSAFNPTISLIARKLKYIGVLLLPVAWFVFAIDYTGAFSLKRHRLLGLLIIPSLTMLGITFMSLRTIQEPFATLNEGLRHILADHPLWYFIQTLYSNALFFGGIYLLASVAIRSLSAYRDQARRILWTVTIPLVSLMIGLVGPQPLPIDMLPLAFTLSGGLMLAFLLRKDPLPIFGLSYEAIIGNMPDGVVVLDRNDVIVTVNKGLLQFSDAFEAGQLEGRSVSEAFAYWPVLLERILDEDNSSAAREFMLGNFYVDLVVSALHHSKGHIIGRILVFRDVTARKQSELALVANERRYVALFETNNDAIFIIDLDWTIILANKQAATLLETSFEQIIGANTTDFIHPEEHTNSNTRLMRLLAGEDVPLYERRFVRPNGSIFPTEVNLTLVRDAEGEPLHIQMVMRDISTRKEAEAALAAERNRLRTLIDTVPDEVIMKGADGAYTLANAAFLKRVGLTELEALLGKTDDDIFPAELADEIIGDDQITLQSGRTYTREQLISRAGAEPQWVANTRAPLSAEDGHISGLVTISRNISESKAYQKALQDSVEQLAVLRQVDEEVNSTLKINHVTLVALDAALRLSGADAGFIAVTRDEMVEIVHQVGSYKNNHDFVVVPDQGIAGRVLVNQRPEMVLSALEDPDYVAYIPETRALMVIPLISQARLVGMLNLETRDPRRFNEEIFQFIQLVAGRVSVALDNARLHDYVRQQLAELQHIHEELSKLEKLKTDMIRIASHDLKNPLGIIHGYLAMLGFDREMFNEEHQSYFDAMERSVIRMTQMLEDILSLEAIQQRASGANISYLCLTEMVSKAVEEYVPQAEKKNQLVDLKIQEEAVWVRGDPAQLYEAVTNIISNAIKYTPEAGRVSIHLHAEKDQAVFDVHDSGYGIPEDRQERLFEPFYRAQAEGTESIEGTGLGLHLVKNIIERHNGSMIFSSIYGQGSQFGFNLPLSSRDELEAAQLI